MVRCNPYPSKPKNVIYTRSEGVFRAGHYYLVRYYEKYFVCVVEVPEVHILPDQVRLVILKDNLGCTTLSSADYTKPDSPILFVEELDCDTAKLLYS
jgi:hypothetical protein